MPSRNSINKPKDTINQARKRASVSRKRAARARNGEFAPARSSEASTSGLPKSTALALYNGASQSGVLTTKTLSKKRSQKIERNKKYIARRKLDEERLLIDAQANAEESMHVDDEVVKQVEEPKKSKINTIKDALWSVIEDRSTESLIVDSTGEGTTLGGPSFF
ncbi:hypothetical protein WICMUC_003556 [Wickerhamomyces mucosus]|uniref:Ribosome biogenesis protein ALB1 n=1 Tax=Wickerhamomyces mucosus TaxID=1378264 RepID=A0A9P8TBR5_9ASCO|nr:hypothetical protein WICMUC_003556 [Wickerhamomyces mucosus]